MPGRVILAATPIGRVADASAALRDALSSTPVIAAEDTRRLRRLLRDLEVDPGGRIVSYFDGNERERTAELVTALLDGDDVLVVTDAGMPSISDPGYRLVRAALDEGIAVTVVPGPSAVLAALAVSGLPVDRFVFEGFLPRKQGERRRAVAALAHEARTVVLFEAPHRLASCLADLAQALGADRRAAVCRELTKTHEEVRRGTLADLRDWAVGGDVRGEITVVVDGAPQRTGSDLSDRALADLVFAREAAGLTRKEAVADVAAETGRPRREVFDAVVAHRVPR